MISTKEGGDWLIRRLGDMNIVVIGWFRFDPVLLEIILRTELWSCERTAGFMYR